MNYRLYIIEHILKEIQKSTHVIISRKGKNDNNVLSTAKLIQSLVPINHPIVSDDKIFAFRTTLPYNPSTVSSQHISPGDFVCLQPHFNNPKWVTAQVTSTNRTVRMTHRERPVGILRGAIIINHSTDDGASGSGIRKGPCNVPGDIIALVSTKTTAAPFSHNHFAELIHDSQTAGRNIGGLTHTIAA